MSAREYFTTPVGRLVMGSLYDAQTTDAEGNLLVYKKGPKQGQTYVKHFFAVAIQKGSETHWSQTPWGQHIYTATTKLFPQGQYNIPSFAWKVVDGDSIVPNSKGIAPATREGYKGHWVVSFTSGFAAQVFNRDGTQQIIEPKYVNLGDYVQVCFHVTNNKSEQQPGIIINHKYVAFVGYGDRIAIGPDPKSVGFGNNTQLPAGASLTPKQGNFNPQVPQAQPQYVPPVGTQLPAGAPAPAQYAPPPAYPQILAAAAAPAPSTIQALKKMTAKANGVPYESYIAAGYNDAMLIQNGLMEV